MNAQRVCFESAPFRWLSRTFAEPGVSSITVLVRSTICLVWKKQREFVRGETVNTEPILTGELVRDDLAFVLITDGDDWKLTWLPASVLEACKWHSGHGEVALASLARQSGVKYKNVDKLVDTLRGQLLLRSCLRKDPMYREDAQREEQRVWRIYSIVLPFLHRLIGRTIESKDSDREND